MLSYAILGPTATRRLPCVDFFRGPDRIARVVLGAFASATIRDRDFSAFIGDGSVFGAADAADAVALLSVLRDELIELGVVHE